MHSKDHRSRGPRRTRCATRRGGAIDAHARPDQSDGSGAAGGASQPWSTRLLVDGFDRVAEALPATLAGLDAAAVLWQPDPAANSIGWLVWHLARVEDDHLAGIAAATIDRDLPADEAAGQVWLTDGWAARFGLPYPDRAIGYGQSGDDVAAFDVGDPEVLLGYYAAVHARTVAIVTALPEADLGIVVDDRWDPPVTAAVRLVSVINDITAHYGQAAYLRGLLDRRAQS